MTDPLLTCPFCGDTSNIKEGFEYGPQLHAIKCVGIEKDKRHVIIAAYGYTAEEARLSWNTRTPSISYDDAVKKLRLRIKQWRGREGIYDGRIIADELDAALAALGIGEGK